MDEQLRRKTTSADTSFRNAFSERGESWIASIEKKWKAVIAILEETFGEGLEMEGILFLIGVQELGLGKRTFKKDQKLELLHIAICTLLEPYGFYRFLGKDEDGYPHWEVIENLPPLKPGHQAALMKEAVINYFENAGMLEAPQPS